MNISIWIILIIIILTIIRVKTRGYFWKDKKGSKLTFKQFLSRWKDGVEETTPLQQTRITLWSFPALMGGIAWGVVITLLGKQYWLSIILLASLPITSMQILSTWQKYIRLKMTEKMLKEAIKYDRRKTRTSNSLSHSKIQK